MKQYNYEEWARNVDEWVRAMQERNQMSDHYFSVKKPKTLDDFEIKPGPETECDVCSRAMTHEQYVTSGDGKCDYCF